MAVASNIQWCEPCGRDGENQQAHSWCSDCSEPICGECLKFHRKGKTTANHKTIPILQAGKLGSSVLNIPDTCHIHEDQKLSLFCIHHDQICCAFCLRESHKTCVNVQSIEKASKGVKMGTAIEDLQRRISEFSLMISKILDVYKNNLSSLSGQKDDYRGKIRNFRKELNTYLDALEQEIDKKIDTCDKECRSLIEKKIKDLTTKQNKSASRQTAIETLKEHASETRIFAAIKTIDLLQVEEEVFLTKLEEDLVNYKLCSSQFPFELIEKIKSILARLSELNIEKIKTAVPHPLNVKQVHAYKNEQKPELLYTIGCSQLKMKIMNKACFTMDDRIVFNGMPFRVYDLIGSSVRTIQVSFSASNLTCGLSKNIYASFPSVGVYNIDIKNLNEGRFINKTRVKPGDYRLVKLNNTMLYSNIENGIVIFNEDGTVVKTLHCTCRAEYMCLDKRGEILISEGKSIIYMTVSGSHSEIPIKMRTGDEITGLDVDNQGQLFACICNKEKGAVERINTTTGYREPVLENLVTPRAIAFHPDPTKNMFLVMTDHGKECTIYQFRNKQAL